VARADHWDAAYVRHGIEGVSWYQAAPTVSLELIAALDVPRDGPVLDAGGGGSSLAGELARRGFRDVTVLDLSQAGLDAT
jgi:2-polyprenyl-3-methyl-5-hydroxy-6-metoxy-1,4-benzoquinol methylase